MHKQPLRGFLEPFCHSDKAIMLKGPAPRECYRPCPFSFLRSPCFLTHFFFPSPPLVFCHSYITTGLYHTPSSYMRHYSRMSPGIHVCAGHSCTSQEGGEGGDIKAAHIQSTDATCAKRGAAHTDDQSECNTRMHATHT